MRRLRGMVAGLALATSAGCATQYGSQTFTGGYLPEERVGRVAKVSFTGNGFIEGEKVAQYARFRAAEYARDAGKPYFILYADLLAAARDVPCAEPTVGVVGGKPHAFAYVLPVDAPLPAALETAAVLREKDAALAGRRGN